jgi:hypothetical protein
MRLFLYSMSRSPVQILATLFDTGRCRRWEGGRCVRAEIGPGPGCSCTIPILPGAQQDDARDEEKIKVASVK